MSSTNKNIDIEISVVSPVYGRELDLAGLCSKLVSTFEKIGVTYEIILVNDGSPDNALDVIKELGKKIAI